VDLMPEEALGSKIALTAWNAAGKLDKAEQWQVGSAPSFSQI
jgi:hypothetical protein